MKLKNKKWLIFLLIIIFVAIVVGLFCCQRRNTQGNLPTPDPSEVDSKESDISVSDYRIYDYEEEQDESEREVRFNQIQQGDGADNNEAGAVEGSGTLVHDESANEGGTFDFSDWFSETP